MCDDISVVQPTRDQIQEGVTPLLCPQSLSRHSFPGNVVEDNLKQFNVYHIRSDTSGPVYIQFRTTTNLDLTTTIIDLSVSVLLIRFKVLLIGLLISDQ